jgi:hypothetical protein
VTTLQTPAIPAAAVPPPGRPGRTGAVVATVATISVVGLAAAGVWAIGRTIGVVGPPCHLTTKDGVRDLSRAEALDATTAALVAQRRSAQPADLAKVLFRIRNGELEQVGPASATAALKAARTAGAAPAAELAEARALLGYDGPALACGARQGGVGRQAEGKNGLTPRADHVRAGLVTVAGPQKLGGFAPGGVTSGHMEGSAHYEGRAIDVFVRPVSDRNTRRGWTMAHWAVAHAEELQLATVIFSDHIWTARSPAHDWRPYTPPEGPTRNAVLRHLDHVHLDVPRGS